MIIPIRCFTCGKVIAGKWKRYQERSAEVENGEKSPASQQQQQQQVNPSKRYFDPNLKGDILDELGLDKICCRRHLLTHVDLVDIL